MSRIRRSRTLNEALYGDRAMPRNAPGVVTNRIIILRRRSRLTQGELAKILDYSPHTVSKHERGLINLSAKDIVAYSRVFKCASYEIFQEPPIPQPDWDDDQDTPP